MKDPTDEYRKWALVQNAQDGDPNRYEIFKAGWDASAGFLGEAAEALRAAQREATSMRGIDNPMSRAALLLGIGRAWVNLAAVERGLPPMGDEPR